jgi:hypothetical protein
LAFGLKLGTADRKSLPFAFEGAKLKALMTSLRRSGTIVWGNEMSFQITSPNTEAAVLARLIQIEHAELSRGAAEYLLSIRFDERDTARMNQLSELARQG